MKEPKRYFGKLIFPQTQEEIENIWLFITDEQIYVEIPMSLYGDTSWDVVHGVFNRLGNVSLINVITSGGSSGAGGQFRKLIVSTFVERIHLRNKNDAFCDNLHLQSDALNNWIGRNFKIDFRNQKINIPNDIELVNISNSEFNFRLLIKYHLDRGENSVNLSRKTYLLVDFQKKTVCK